MFDTARLRIRSFLNSDTDNIFRMFNEYPVQTGARGGNIVPFPESFKDEIKGWGDKNLLFGVVEEKDSLEFVGTIALWNINGVKNRDANLAITLREASWGMGYGTELMTWLVDHAFRGLGLHRLSLEVFGFNERACALYKKIGFVEEGRRRKGLWFNGKWEDIIAMGILEEEFWARAQ